MPTMKTIMCLTIALMPSLTFASWSGPQEVISGPWGSGQGQFYYASGDTTDSFPREIGIDKDGNVLIADEGNKRLLIYNSSGITSVPTL